MAIESDTFFSDGDFGQMWPDFSIKAVVVHPEIAQSILEADDAR
jgi:hypothetical protein